MFLSLLCLSLISATLVVNTVFLGQFRQVTQYFARSMVTQNRQEGETWLTPLSIRVLRGTQVGLLAAIVGLVCLTDVVLGLLCFVVGAGSAFIWTKKHLVKPFSVACRRLADQRHEWLSKKEPGFEAFLARSRHR
jgi:hypothetical protein